MTNTIPFNPMQTTVAAGTFNVTSEGYIQGTALNDPAIRNLLSGGYLAPTETLPMWGGVGISEYIPGSPESANAPNQAMGSKIGRATNVTAAAAGQLTGFSVFDQLHAALISPQNPVPISLANMSVHFYRLGSNARVPVQFDPALITLEDDIITSQVSWDYENQMLIPYVAAYPANVFTALTRALVGGTYVATATTTTAHGINVGSDFNVSGTTPAAYNGQHTAIAGTAGSTLKWNIGPTDPGAETVLGQLDAGGGALPVRVINVKVGNCMTVDYDPATGVASWDRDGSCAVILI